MDPLTYPSGGGVDAESGLDPLTLHSNHEGADRPSILRPFNPKAKVAARKNRRIGKFGFGRATLCTPLTSSSVTLPKNCMFVVKPD